MTPIPRLPDGWVWSTVAGVGDVQLGRQRAPRYHYGPNMRPYLRVANVFEDRIDTSDVMEMDFAPSEFERYRLRPGDVLLNEGQSPQFLGRPAVYRGSPPDVAFTNSLLRFRAGPAVTPEWALIVFREHMHSGRFARESRITTNIAHLSAARLKSVEFPVPPLDEQKRISAFVDEQLATAAGVTTALEVLARKLRFARKRLLDSAVSASLLTKSLGEILAEPLANGRSVPTADGGFPVLRLTALREGRIDLTQSKPGAWDAAAARPWLVERGDFLVARGNGSLRLVGRGGVVGEVSEPVAYPDTLIRVRVDPVQCDLRYLQVVWESTGVRKQIEAAARTTAGIYKINQRDLAAVIFPLPPLDVQRQIVTVVANVWAGLDTVVAGVERLVRLVDAFKRTVLRTAATGRLLPQDPAEGRAEFLLKRICEDRANARPDARRKQPRTVHGTRSDRDRREESV